ncbi:MAG: chromosome segregation protein SMC [Halobacteriota archaeon]|nr:chromosome segregation protein SMC [Halobacteriota archaeon]
MHIKEIEIKNFKSFNRVKIPFYEDFTTISGPNGSGKSNIIDAIIFTLGLSSSRTMRAERLTDLINSSNSDNLKLSEVTIKFDNKDRKIPLDMDDVTVTRRIKRTENGYYSYFYLNGKPCNLSDVHRELGKSGISPEGYNVIMQGDVTQILKMGAYNRRKIIEEIAGVSEFDSKIEKAVKQLEIVKDRIGMIDIILSEVETRMEELRYEKDQALKYNELRNDKKKYESLMIISKLLSAEGELEKIKRDIEEKQLAKDALAKNILDINGKITECEDKLRDLNKEISEKGEAESIKIKGDIENILVSISRCEGIVEIAQNELSDLIFQQKKSLIQQFDGYKRIRKVSGDLTEEAKKKEEWISKLDKKRVKLEEINSSISEVDIEYKEIGAKISKMKLDLEVQKNNKNELIRNIDRLTDAFERRSHDEEMAKEMLKESIDLRTELVLSRDDASEILKDIREKIKNVSADLSDLELGREKIRAEVSVLREDIKAAEREHAKKEAMVKSSQKNRFSHPVSLILEAAMEGVLDGVHGTVADLCKVDKDYNLALEIAAGNRMQSIVVENDHVAADAINYLKARGAGRATFLPLNKMNGRLLDDINAVGVVDYAINLIDFDPIFYPAFWFVFRDTVVVDGMDAARRLLREYRLVTLEGELMEKSGAMTGGSAKSRFLPTEDDVTKLKDQITMYEQDLDLRSQNLSNVEDHISKLRNDALELRGNENKSELELKSINERINSLNDKITQKSTRITELTTDCENLSEEINRLKYKVQEKDDVISGVEEGVFELEQLFTDSEARKINEEADIVLSEIQSIDDEVRRVDSNMSELFIKKEYLKREIVDHKGRLDQLELKKDDLNKKTSFNRSEICRLEEELGIKRELERVFSLELNDLRKLRDDQMASISEFGRKKEENLRSFDRIEETVSILEDNSEHLIASISEMIKEVGEFDIDPKDVPDYEIIQKNVLIIEKKMNSLEPVNMRAIAEYDAVLQRKEMIKSRRDVLVTERKEIIERMDSYAEMKREVFMESFDAINKNFKDTFEELSGGYGELLLENSDDPFAGGMSIRARPAGKNLIRLEAMSGGEKSLTALSFLFAIQRYRPAPFYALDEVDMFLDGSNVDRVAKMIKKLARGAQFIVVSLREPMIESADRTIGVVMQEKNLSSVTGIRLSASSSENSTKGENLQKAS